MLSTLSNPGRIWYNQHMKKHGYLSVMGTMGSGKTSASRLLSEKLKLRLIEENFGENAFLPRFYGDMHRWAFHSQTFFLMEKITQMMETAQILASRNVVQDTPIEQDVFSYAKAQHVLGNMDDAEWRLYQKIYRSFVPYFPKPTLIVYLDTSITEVEKRIESRGREYEQKIPSSYLELLEMLNRKWLTENRDIPVISIQTDGLNIIRSTKAQSEFVAMVRDGIRALHGSRSASLS
jgi:deoxyadenosine/deoxycytidine kinase